MNDWQPIPETLHDLWCYDVLCGRTCTRKLFHLSISGCKQPNVSALERASECAGCACVICWNVAAVKANTPGARSVALWSRLHTSTRVPERAETHHAWRLGTLCLANVKTS